MISNRRRSLKTIANVDVDTDTRFVLLFTGDCACCFHPRLPIVCAVLQHVRHETMVGVGPGKRQGVCELIHYQLEITSPQREAGGVPVFVRPRTLTKARDLAGSCGGAR